VRGRHNQEGPEAGVRMMSGDLMVGGGVVQKVRKFTVPRSADFRMQEDFTAATCKLIGSRARGKLLNKVRPSRDTVWPGEGPGNWSRQREGKLNNLKVYSKAGRIREREKRGGGQNS
jgi:hypothetical protein